MDNELKMNDRKGNRLAIVAGVILVLAIIGGGFFAFKTLSNSTNQEEQKNQQKEDVPVEPKKEESKIKIVDVNSKTRPFGIMVNCHNEALPQSGLQDAYMVYEIMVEYGITRMFALFKDVDFSKVGSIRSLRSQYIAYAFENDAVIAHAGGQLEATNRLSNEGIAHVDVDGKYGQRDKELAKKRAWEHTLFTNSSLLTKALNDMNIRKTTESKPLLTYSADPVDLSKYETKQANKITIKYSNYRTSSYDYDSSSTNYLRNIGNKKNVDLVTGKQYQVKNIIVYGVKYETYTLRGTGYQKMNNIGTGGGYYITNGVALPITWSKTDEKSKTVYKIKETGEELKVNDGNTYIQIYPSNGGKLTIS